MFLFIKRHVLILEFLNIKSESSKNTSMTNSKWTTPNGDENTRLRDISG